MRLMRAGVAHRASTRKDATSRRSTPALCVLVIFCARWAWRLPIQANALADARCRGSGPFSIDFMKSSTAGVVARLPKELMAMTAATRTSDSRSEPIAAVSITSCSKHVSSPISKRASAAFRCWSGSPSSSTEASLSEAPPSRRSPMYPRASEARPLTPSASPAMRDQSAISSARGCPT